MFWIGPITDHDRTNPEQQGEDERARRDADEQCPGAREGARVPGDQLLDVVLASRSTGPRRTASGRSRAAPLALESPASPLVGLPS